MGKTKTTLFSKQQNDLAALAKAIAHPARIAILEYLLKKGSCVCGDIVDELPLSQSTISQHLKAMKAAGIIKGEVEGTYRCYCVNMETCAELTKSLQTIFSTLGKTGACC